MFGKKKIAAKSFDRETLKPVIKCSICTGEQVAGFQNMQTGKFEDIMLIRDEKDLEIFMKTYDLKDVEKIY